LNSLEQQRGSQIASKAISPQAALPLEAEPPDPPGPDSTGFRKAAERGDADAQNNLGASYANGDGVPQNYALAIKWYRRAAKQGNSMAQKNLGACYYNGQGVEQNFVEAYKWYAVAAANGERSKAAMFREDAAARLSPSQMARAQSEAAELFEQLRNGRWGE
jgi:TPR repeat protein